MSGEGGEGARDGLAQSTDAERRDRPRPLARILRTTARFSKKAWAKLRQWWGSPRPNHRFLEQLWFSNSLPTCCSAYAAAGTKGRAFKTKLRYYRFAESGGSVHFSWVQVNW